MNKNKAICLAVILISFCYQGSAQSNNASPSDSDPQQRHAAYLELNRQIFARHEDPGSGNLSFSPEKGRLVSQQVKQMLTREIEIALSAPKPSAKDVTSAIARLQGDITLANWEPELTNVPFAKLFSLNGVPTMAVAYAILQGGDAIPDTQAYLDFYDDASGVWTKKATAPTLADFEGCTFSAAQLNAGLPGDAWFLAWGVPFGSSHALAHVRLYAFDGFTVRTIWKRDDLAGGKITTTPDSVTLDYIDFPDDAIEHHEVLHVTPNGLALATERSEHM